MGSGEVTDIRQELARRGFVRAGQIQPVESGRSCSYEVKDIQGFVIYAHVVGDLVMKFGTTSPSLRSRVSQNAATINQVIDFIEGRAPRKAKWHERPLDRFKQMAPLAIKANQSIEIWAVQSTAEDYKRLERELNGTFNTMAKGWTMQLG